MKIILLIILNVLIQSSTFGCDCDFIYRSTNYLKYETIFIAVLEQEYKSKTSEPSYKWESKIIKLIKGEILDTIYTGDFCGIRYNEGDTVLIYGFNNEKINWTRTGLCFGNRIIGSKKWNDKTKSKLYDKYRKIGQIETTILEFYKEAIGEIEYKELPKFFKYGSEAKYGNFSNEFYRSEILKEDVEIVYVKLLVSNDGKITKLRYLNNAPKRIKKSINMYLRENIWKIPLKSKYEEITIIECFIY